MLAIELSDGIDIGDKFIVTRQRPSELDLQVLFGMGNTDAIILSEFLKQMNALVSEPIPGIPFA